MADDIAAAPRRVLYAEDDRVAALLFAEALRGHDYVVQVAETGEEALELARQWRPDVLVLDANLPDTTGLELLAELRAQADLAAAPAFVCSADGLDDDRARHLQAGFCGFWQKPVDRARLVADLDALPAAHRP